MSCSAAHNIEPIGSLKHTKTPLVFLHWAKSGGESVQSGLQYVAAASRFNFVQLHGMHGNLRWNRTLNSKGTKAAEEGDPWYVATSGTIVSWVRRDDPAVSPPGVFWFPRSPLVTWVRDPVSRFISAWRAQATTEANTTVSLNAELSADATTWDTHLHAAADLAYYLLGAVPLRAPTNTSCRRSTSGPQSEACLIGVVSDEPTRGRVAWAELLPFKPMRAAAVAGHRCLYISIYLYIYIYIYIYISGSVPCVAAPAKFRCPLVSRLCPVRCSTGDFPLSLWSAGSVPCVAAPALHRCHIHIYIHRDRYE